MTLSTPAFVWLHASAWEPPSHQEIPGDFAFFYNERLTAHNALCAPPPYCISRKNRIPPHLAGRWILKNREGASRAWAEAHTFGGDFPRVHLVFGVAADLPSTEDWIAAAIAMLASACMVVTEAALVYLLPASATEERIIAGTQDFNPVPVWVPAPLASKREAGHLIKLRKIESATWWDMPRGAEIAKQVAYLCRRVEFRKQEERKKKTPPKRRLSLFRLFFPRSKT